MEESSWAWGPGPAGVTDTAGVAIVSATVVEEVIEAAAARQPVAAVMLVAAARCAVAESAAVRLTTM
jgi:hypothetical protein